MDGRGHCPVFPVPIRHLLQLGDPLPQLLDLQSGKGKVAQREGTEVPLQGFGRVVKLLMSNWKGVWY